MAFSQQIQRAEKAFLRGALTYLVDAKTFDVQYVHQELRREGNRQGKRWKYGKWRKAVVIKPLSVKE